MRLRWFFLGVFLFLVTLQGASAGLFQSMNTTGDGLAWVYADKVNCFNVTPTTTFTLHNVSAYFSAPQGSGASFRWEVYASNSSHPTGTPITFFGGANPGSEGWFNQVDPTPNTILNVSEEYWLCADALDGSVSHRQLQEGESAPHTGMVWLNSDDNGSTWNQPQSVSMFAHRVYGVAFAPVDAINLSLLLPTDNDHTNDLPTTFQFNLSALNTVNCTLNIATPNGSTDFFVPTNGTLTNINSGIHNYTTIHLNETVYDWYVNCADESVNESSDDTYTVYLDYTAPDWTLSADNFFAADNSTGVRAPEYNLTQLVNATVDDTYLWAYNVTITNSTGVKRTNQTSGLTSSVENFTDYLNLSSWPSDTYTVNFYAEDDHTKKSIPDYGVNLGAQSITYATPTADVTITSTRMDGGSFTTEKNGDRYTFTYTPNESTSTWTFTITSSKPLHHRGSLYPFPAFVTGRQWVDFDTGNPATIYEVFQEDAYTYELEIETENESEISFNSIGGLNSVNESYQFVLDQTPRNVNNLTAWKAGTSWIFLNWTIDYWEINGTELYRDGSLIGNWTNGTVYFNDTGLSSGTTYTYTFHTYRSDTEDYNTTPIIGESQLSTDTIFNGSLSVEIRNELTEALITDQIFVNLISDAYNSSDNTTTGQIDISNITTENYTLRHTGIGWGLRDQYVTILQNQTGEITLYLINDTYRTGLEVEVRDTTGEVLSGAVLRLLRYYGSCNCYNVVEEATTTTEGIAVMSAQAYDAYYKWVVEYDGATEYLSSTPENFYPSSDGLIHKVFTVNIGGDYYESYIAGVDIAGNVTWNPSTETLSYIWNDPSGIVTNGCLKAYYADSADWVLVGPNCSSGASGSVNLNLPSSTARTYKYNAYLLTSTTYSTIEQFSGWLDKARTLIGGTVGGFLYAGVILAGALLLSFSAILVLAWTLIAVVGGSLLGFLPFGTSALIGLGTLVVGVSVYLLRK